MMKRSIIFFLIILALIGVADSSYLTAQHYRGEDVVCTIGEQAIGDCSTVTGSEYAVVAGIPIALMGVGYYFVLLILAASMLSYDSRKLRQLFTAIVSIGLLVSLYFVYLQLFVLNAICVYCMVSAVSTSLLFILSFWPLQKREAI